MDVAVTCTPVAVAAEVIVLLHVAVLAVPVVIIWVVLVVAIVIEFDGMVVVSVK